MRDILRDGRKDVTKSIIALHCCFAIVSTKKEITENGKK
jgi:hypothetical protein